jgi:hypothetical protein
VDPKLAPTALILNASTVPPISNLGITLFAGRKPAPIVLASL